MKPLERFGFLILVLLITVMSAASVLSARNAEKAAKKADLIAQCSTPGTACAKLQEDSRLRQSAQVVCPALIPLPPPAEREAKRDQILQDYRECVEDVYHRLKAAPLPGTTPTTVQED